MKKRDNRHFRNRRMLFKLCAILTIALATQRAGATVGLMQWSFSYKATDVPVAVWFPASAAATDIDAGPFTLRAAPGAVIAEEKHPLIVISHGTGGSNIAHHPLAESLAATGYIVAALEHPGDNYQDRSLLADPGYFADRPRQLTALLGALQQDAKLGKLIDRNRIGAIGHSVGGYTVAAAVGALPDRDTLIEHCNAVSDDPACQYRDPEIGVTAPTDKPFKPDGDAVVESDQPALQIRSVVLLAPLGSVVAIDSVIDHRVAVKIIVAEHDQVLPQKYHLQRLQKIAPQAQTRVAPGAGHFSFIAPVTAKWREQLGEVAADPDEFDRTAFNEALGQELGLWFSKTLSSQTH